MPWARLLGNPNLWPLCLMYFTSTYGWYFLIFWMPDYLSKTFAVSKETVGLGQYGLMAGLPLLAGSVACLVGGLLTDFAIRRTGNRKWGRRFCGVEDTVPAPLCYVAAAHAQSGWTFIGWLAVLSFCNDLAMGFRLGKLSGCRQAVCGHRGRLHEHHWQPGRPRPASAPPGC